MGAREPAVAQLLDRAMIGGWLVSGLLLAFAVAVDLGAARVAGFPVRG